MKKILSLMMIAVFILSAGAAHAFTVYKKDGLTYKIKGDLQLQFRKDVGNDQDLDLEYDDLEIKNSVKYDLGNGLSAFGQLDFGFKDAADKSTQDEPELEEAYLGLGYQSFKVYFGKTDNAADEFGVEGAYEEPIAEDAFDEAGTLDGDDLIGFAVEFGSDDLAFVVVATHELEAESEASDDNGTFTDIWAEVSFSGLKIAAAYQTYEAVGAEEIDLYGVSVAYDAGFAEFGADYSTAEDDHDFYNLFVAVPVKVINTTFGLGYQLKDPDASGADDIAAWYLNATYKFPAQKNVSLFAEVADTDEDNVDLGYLVGMRIKF